MDRLKEIIESYEAEEQYIKEFWDNDIDSIEPEEVPIKESNLKRVKDTITYLKELQRYKDLEEQGRLIESQYMAGETVWCLQEDYEYNWDAVGYKFMGICGDYIIVTTEYIGMTFKEQLDEMCEEVAEYGSTDIYIFHKSRTFTTKAEAEARLKEMEGTQE